MENIGICPSSPIQLHLLPKVIGRKLPSSLTLHYITSRYGRRKSRTGRIVYPVIVAPSWIQVNKQIEKQSSALLVPLLSPLNSTLLLLPPMQLFLNYVVLFTVWSRWFVGNWVKKSLWSFAHVVRGDHVNRARNADHAARTCERFVYSIVKIRFYDYQTWLTHSQGAQRYVGFFHWLCFSNADWLNRQTPIMRLFMMTLWENS